MINLFNLFFTKPPLLWVFHIHCNGGQSLRQCAHFIHIDSVAVRISHFPVIIRRMACMKNSDFTIRLLLQFSIEVTGTTVRNDLDFCSQLMPKLN